MSALSGRRPFARWGGGKGSPRPLGSGDEVGPALAEARLTELGRDGELATALDRAANVSLATLQALSELTVPLALAYLDRITRPLTALDSASAVRVTARGYAAHLAVELRGRDLGIETVPVLGGLPPMKNGQPPPQLLTTIVKVTRRSFETVRAVSEQTWTGLVICVARRTHAERVPDADGELGPPLDAAVIDALLRFGWVLRQVDLHYGFEPDHL